MKLISVTWSYDDVFDYSNTILYKSFLKYNDPNAFINIHYNRSHYKFLEDEFNNKFGYQYEFLLYRIFLLKDSIDNLKDRIIFADNNDVVCLGEIDGINDICNDKIFFSSEQHRYPNEQNISNWNPSYSYSTDDNNNKNYLNAGLSVGNSELYVDLFDDCIDNIFTKEYKNFGGDQGIYTYYYINKNKLIVLDYNTKYFLSTYSRNPDSFIYNNGRIINRQFNSMPLFIHDNGWNYGSPKFIERFNLL
jgi:hypothetical protein